MPKGSIDLSYSVKNLTLTFHIIHDYENIPPTVFMAFPNPLLWVACPASFVTDKLKAQPTLQKALFYFNVNERQGKVAEMMFSCTGEELLAARKEAQGKPLDECIKIYIMHMMETENN